MASISFSINLEHDQDIRDWIDIHKNLSAAIRQLIRADIERKAKGEQRPPTLAQIREVVEVVLDEKLATAPIIRATTRNPQAKPEPEENLLTGFEDLFKE